MALDREIVYILLQFLEEENYHKTRFMLEQESGYFFNCPRFEALCLSGKWQEAEEYLLGFTSIEDNRFSMKMMFEIRKQKYLEALDRKDLQEATKVLLNELRVFTVHNDALFKEMTYLLTLDNFRENEKLSNYGDTRSARVLMVAELKKLVEANPAFTGKLHFPAIHPSRLRAIINQTMDVQQQLNSTRNALVGAHSSFMPAGTYNDLSVGSERVPQLATLPTFPPVVQTAAAGLASVAVPRASLPVVPPQLPVRPQKRAGLPVAPQESKTKRPKQTDKPADTDKPAASKYDMSCLPVKIAGKLFLPDDAGPVTSLDFHSNSQHLLCGTKKGTLLLYDLLDAKNPLITRQECQSSAATDKEITRVVWASKSQQRVMAANLCGIAFADSVFQLYHKEGNTLSMLLEVPAHEGRVNDLAFARVGNPNPKLCALSCGDDKCIKVWDVEHGECVHAFVGHEGPVLSIWPHRKESISFVFSTSTDGRIRAWLYFDQFHRVDYSAPGKCCTYIAYSEDGSRLFSCGMPKDGTTGALGSSDQLGKGDSCLTEWNETEGTIKGGYLGFRSTATSARFASIKNKFLVAVSDGYLKFWDMDLPKPIHSFNLSMTDADFDPNAAFAVNKEGTIVAVASRSECLVVCCKSSLEGALSYLTMERVGRSALAGVPDTDNGTKPDPGEPDHGKKALDMGIATDHPDTTATPTSVALTGIRRFENKEKADIEVVIFANSGESIATLCQSGANYIWRRKKSQWKLHEVSEPMQNASSSPPEHFCGAISRNDAYLLSSSGSQIALYNLISFKHMISFSPPPPTASILAFSPRDNNLMALGMDNGMIHIYNVKLDELVHKLKGGHESAVTSLLFCNEGVLSVCKDSQLCLWNSETWELMKSLSIPPTSNSEEVSSGKSITGKVSIHPIQDDEHVLVAHPHRLTVLRVKDFTVHKSLAVGDDALACACCSCDNAMVIAATTAGFFLVFDSDLRPRLRSPLAKIVPQLGDETIKCVSRHPSKPRECVLGFSKGLMAVVSIPQLSGQQT